MKLAEQGLLVLVGVDTVIFCAYMYYDDFSMRALSVPVVVLTTLIIGTAFVLILRQLNLSLAKDIAKQVTVVMITFLLVINIIMHIVVPKHALSPVLALLLLVVLLLNIFIDAVTPPLSRALRLIICAGSVIALASLLVSLYGHTNPCTDEDDTISRALNGRLSKVLIQRTVYSQLLVLHAQAVLVLSRDSKQEFLPFSLGPISKRSGVLAVHVPAAREISTTRREWKFAWHKHETPVLVFGMFGLVFHACSTFPYGVFGNSNVYLVTSIGLVICAVGVEVSAVVCIFWRNVEWFVVKQSLQQFSVVTIVSCLTTNVIIDVVAPEDEFVLPNTILFTVVIGMNAMLDAAVRVSRFVKLTWFLANSLLLFLVVAFYYIEKDPCKPDSLTSLFGRQLNLVIAKRGIFTTLFIMHLRAAVLFILDHNDEYFVLVTGQVRKHQTALFLTANSNFPTNSTDPPATPSPERTANFPGL